MSKQADVQVPEEAAYAMAKWRHDEILRRGSSAASLDSFDRLPGKIRRALEASAAIELRAALPSLIDHFRERLLSDEARAAAASAAANPPRRVYPSTAALHAALATAFQDNTDSQGGTDERPG